VVAESPGGIRILDQHALHERKLYDELMARFERAAGEDQLLLVPHTADLAAADRERVLASAPALSRLGLAVEPFGRTAVALRSVPAVLAAADPDRILHAVVECLGDAGRASARDVIGDVVAHLACKAAVKFNDALPEAEVAALLAWEAAHPEARNCPHGRNTALELSLRDLETRFQRKK
jgi:DNA mismatch repair protein MutL